MSFRDWAVGAWGEGTAQGHWEWEVGPSLTSSPHQESLSVQNGDQSRLQVTRWQKRGLQAAFSVSDLGMPSMRGQVRFPELTIMAENPSQGVLDHQKAPETQRTRLQ